MRTAPIDDIALELAHLADLPETSFALRAYLKSTAERDIVDVMNEIDLLARTLSDHAPEMRGAKREP